MLCNRNPLNLHQSPLATEADRFMLGEGWREWSSSENWGGQVYPDARFSLIGACPTNHSCLRKGMTLHWAPLPFIPFLSFLSRLYIQLDLYHLHMHMCVIQWFLPRSSIIPFSPHISTESYCGSSRDIIKKMEISRKTLIFVTPQSGAFTKNTRGASNLLCTGLIKGEKPE